MGFPNGSAIKNLLPVQETWVLSLIWEDPREEGMATHSSIPAWRIPWTEDPGSYSPGAKKRQTRLKRQSAHHIQYSAKLNKYYYDNAFERWEEKSIQSKERNKCLVLST